MNSGIVDVTGNMAGWAARAELLLKIGFSLKQQIGTKPDEKKGKEGTGLLKRLGEIEDELRLIIVEHHLGIGLSYGNIQFTVEPRAGRRGLDAEKLIDELLNRGVDSRTIQDALEAAVTRGNPFWEKEWSFVEEKERET
jgi:hypothetical protein